MVYTIAHTLSETVFIPSLGNPDVGAMSDSAVRNEVVTTVLLMKSGFILIHM